MVFKKDSMDTQNTIINLILIKKAAASLTLVPVTQLKTQRLFHKNIQKIPSTVSKN